MTTNSLERISCTFNIYDNARQFSAIQRGYFLDNFKKAINHPFTRERLKLREMIGYVGHGVRGLSQKMTPDEVDVAKLQNGQQSVIKAIPACVCTELSIDDDGNVTHTQEILDNAEGKVLLGLHKSRVGGFSIAADGNAQGSNTLLDKVYGFDYVTSPNFSSNRGYILDSAESETATEEMILDSITNCGLDSDEAKNRLDAWHNSSALEAIHYRDMTQHMMHSEAALRADHNELQNQFDSVNAELASLKTQYADQEAQRKQLFETFSSRSTVAIPMAIMDSLVSPSQQSDLNPLLTFLEKTAQINGSTLPLGNAHRPQFVHATTPSDYEFGSVETAPDLDTY